jgi:hypothetical protein
MAFDLVLEDIIKQQLLCTTDKTRRAYDAFLKAGIEFVKCRLQDLDYKEECIQELEENYITCLFNIADEEQPKPEEPIQEQQPQKTPPNETIDQEPPPEQQPQTTDQEPPKNITYAGFKNNSLFGSKSYEGDDGKPFNEPIDHDLEPDPEEPPKDEDYEPPWK